MKGLIRTLAVLSVFAVGLFAAPAAQAAPKHLVHGLPLQLALGDSWAFGFGAVPRTEEGYVPQLNDVLRKRYDCLPAQSEEAADGCKQLQLLNIAVGGATTPSLIAGQLPTAVRLLESRNGDDNPRDDVEVTTVHIGGNDVTGPIIAACLGGLSPGCVATIQSEFAAFQADLEVALSTLRDAAGDSAKIVIGTYDNPIPTCVLGSVPGASLLGALVLEGGGPLPAGLHDIIRAVAAAHHIRVAEVFGDLAPEDWLGGNDCLHPDNSGYDKVTASFVEALGL